MNEQQPTRSGLWLLCALAACLALGVTLVSFTRTNAPSDNNAGGSQQVVKAPATVKNTGTQSANGPSADTLILPSAGQEPRPVAIVADEDPVAKWRQGKGEFPFLDARVFSEAELLRGLRELREETVCVDGVTTSPEDRLSAILDALQRLDAIGSLPELRNKFENWKSVQGKLLLATYLAGFEDYTGVPFAEGIARTHQEPQVRIWAIAWVLNQTVTIQVLESISESEKSSMVLDSLRKIIETRRAEQSEYSRLFGHDPRNGEDAEVRGASRKRSQLTAVLRAELYRRAHEPK